MITERIVSLSSAVLGRDIAYTLFIPDAGKSLENHHLLLVNDGQDAAGLRLSATLDELTNGNQIQPLLIAAIVAGERIQEYGVAGRPYFKKRGSRADVYTETVLTEILPSIRHETEADDFASVSAAGCSLGGLSAFDMVWQHPDVFRIAGVFSGSFWWRSRDVGKLYNNATDRIMHQVVREGRYRPGLRFWFEAGTQDELADRDRNGVIDAIDDTKDLIGELEKKGYQAGKDIEYMEVTGGKHDIPTWAASMPKFLTWAFG